MIYDVYKNDEIWKMYTLKQFQFTDKIPVSLQNTTIKLVWEMPLKHSITNVVTRIKMQWSFM